MPVLNSATIAAMPAPKLKAVKVPLPELGEGMQAYIGQMTADERDERIETYWVNRKAAVKQDDNVGLRAFVAAASLCDENRVWVASDEKAINDLADKFSDFAAVPINRMFSHACNLTGLSHEDVEELEKNLPTTTKDGGS